MNWLSDRPWRFSLHAALILLVLYAGSIVPVCRVCQHLGIDSRLPGKTYYPVLWLVFDARPVRGKPLSYLEIRIPLGYRLAIQRFADGRFAVEARSP